MKRLIAVGDIHGQMGKLLGLMELLQPGPEDQFVFLGDYVDRGPDSRGVIDYLIEFKKKFPNAIFIRGNHDQMLLDALVELGKADGQRLRDLSMVFAADAEPSDLDLLLFNGGRQTLASYRLESFMQGLPTEHVKFLQETVFWWCHDEFVFVHAAVENGVALEQQDPYFLLWQRWADPGANGEVHVVGHHPTTNRKPLFEEGRISLDTGAGYGYALTACDVFTKEFWQV